MRNAILLEKKDTNVIRGALSKFSVLLFTLSLLTCNAFIVYVALFPFPLHQLKIGCTVFE